MQEKIRINDEKQELQRVKQINETKAAERILEARKYE